MEKEKKFVVGISIVLIIMFFAFYIWFAVNLSQACSLASILDL